MKKFVLVLGLVAAVAGVMAAERKPVEGTRAAKVKKPKKPKKLKGRRVEIVGLTVSKANPKDKFGGSLIFGRQAGTALNLRIVTKAKRIIAVDKKASKLVHFVDDKGSKLAKPGVSTFKDKWMGMSVTISKDLKVCSLAILSKRTPAKGARELKLKANIVLTCGQDEKTVRQEGLALKAGRKITVGPMPMKVKEAGKPQWGRAKMSITFQSNKSFDAIKALKFFGADGKEIKSSKAGSGQTGFGTSYTYTRSYSLNKKVAVAAVAITYYNKITKLTVPVDISTGVGF